MDLQYSFMRLCTSIAVTCLFYSYAASEDSTYSWQPVQENMQVRGGDYQIGISNEGECKTRCVADQNCIGVDWHAGHRSCFFLLDSGAPPCSASGYSHWRIIRNKSTPTINQGIPTSTTTTTKATETATEIAAATAATTSTMTTAATTAALTTAIAETTAETATTITSAKTITTVTASITHNNIPAQISNNSVISNELLARRTLDTSTLKTPTKSVHIAAPTVTSGQSQTMLSEKSSTPDIANEDIIGTVDDYLSMWQPVQLNVRARTGNFQSEKLNEAGCKARCAQTPNCFGIDWHNSRDLCFLVYDCNSSLHTEIGYAHWKIRRYKSTPNTCQDLVRRHEAQLHPTTPFSVHCNSPENWITVLSVLLGIATLVVAGLMCNTWRLQQKIRSCTCDLKKANFLHQAQANGYQSYEGPVNPPTVYTDIARTLPPIPTDNEIVYADIDDSLRQ